MSNILICGAVSDHNDPFAWQDELAADDGHNHDFTNPYEIGDDVSDPYNNPEKIMEPVVDFVENEADGLLVRWDDDAFLVGAVVYMREAHRRGIPIVIWYDGYRDQMQIPLSWMMRSYHEDRDTAIAVLCSLLGDNSMIAR